MPQNSFKRLLSFLISVLIVANGSSGILCLSTFAAGELTLAEAQRLAIARDGKLKTTKTKSAFQQVKRKRAQEAIADIRKKESTVRFNLLFSIKLPEKHGLPKEVDLLTKLPQIDIETAILGQKAKDIELAVNERVAKVFIKAYNLQESEKVQSARLEQAKVDLTRMKNRALMGLVRKEDMDSLEASCKSAETELISCKQSFEKEAASLAKQTGLNVSTGCVLKNPLTIAKIPRDKLSSMVDYAMKNRYDVFEAESARKLACRNVDQIYGVYKQQFGGKAAVLEPEVRTEGEINYDQFLKKYGKFLISTDQPWAGAYVIRLIFFKIKIPKEWFKGEYSGTRYFEDQKYALPEALRERDDARAQEKITRETVESSIKESYEVLMEFERVYRNAIVQSNRAQKTYEEAKVQNMLGGIAYDELQQKKSNYDQAQKTVQDSLISYNELLVSLNKETCGWVNMCLTGADLVNVNTSFGDSLGYPKARYITETTIDPLQAIFTLTIPSDSGIIASEYELWIDDLRVGLRSKVTEPIIVLPVEIVGIKKVTVKLFDSGKYVDEADFDGMQMSGELDFKVLAAQHEQQAQTKVDLIKGEFVAETNQVGIEQVGQYLIEDMACIATGGVMFKKFCISEVSNGATYFRIGVEGQQGTLFLVDNDTHPISEEVVRLGAMFNNEDKIVITLYDNSMTELFDAKLDPTNKTLVRVN